MPFKDKEKQREAVRRSHRKYSYNYEARKKERKKEIKTWFQELKSQLSCVKCGENHPRCLDFHHIAEKNFLVSIGVTSGFSIQKIKDEIALCEVLCANCHRKIHS